MPLGLKERFDYERNRQQAYSCFIVGAKLTSEISKELLLGAVSQLVDQRRLLRVNIYDGEKEDIKWDIDDSVEWIQVSVMSDALNKIYNTMFYTGVSRPLWKFYVLNSEWILFACDHSLYDGTTGALVVEDILRLINHHNIAPSTDVTPEYERLCTPSILYFLVMVICEIGVLIRTSILFDLFSRSPRTQKKTCGMPSFHTNKHLITLDHDECDKVKSFSKEYGITFTGLWMYLNTLALSEATSRSRIKLSVPVNLRRFINGETSYGNLVSAVTREISPNACWSTVKEAVTIDENEVRSCAQLIGMLNFIDISRFVASQMRIGSRPTLIEISNLGLRPTIGGNITITEYVFSQPLDRMQHCFNNEIISSKHVTTIVLGGCFDPSLFGDYVTNLELLLQVILNDFAGLGEVDGCSRLKKCLERYKFCLARRKKQLNVECCLITSLTHYMLFRRQSRFNGL